MEEERGAYSLSEWEHLIKELGIKPLSREQAIFLIKSFRSCLDEECGLHALNFMDALICTVESGGFYIDFV